MPWSKILKILKTVVDIAVFARGKGWLNKKPEIFNKEEK